MAQITYADKTTMNSNSSIPAINKCQASDMNEIKSVVNNNYSEVGDITTLTTTDKTSVVNAINEVNSKSAITCTTGGENRTINASSTWTSYKETLSTILNSYGNAFSLSNNEIVVNEECYALVSKSGLMRGPSTSQPLVTRISLIRSGSMIANIDSYVYINNSSYWYGVNITPVLWHVLEGDIIRAELLSGATGSIGYGGNTYVSVEKVN